jgi:AraC-like DNA-binding protein
MTAAGLLLDTPAARPCPHRGAHLHGTLQAYKRDRCRCLACREANAAYERERVAARAEEYGRWSAYADVRPVRAHLADLLNAGMSVQSIAERAHLNPRTVRRVLDPDVRRMRRKSAESLLRIKVDRKQSHNEGELWKS